MRASCRARTRAAWKIRAMSRKPRSISEPPGGMHCGDSACEVAHLYARKPRLFDHACERFLRRKTANAFGKIAVRVGIPGNPFAKPRQHGKGIALVQRVQPGRLDAREFETKKPSARLQ